MVAQALSWLASIPCKCYCLYNLLIQLTSKSYIHNISHKRKRSHSCSSKLKETHTWFWWNVSGLRILSSMPYLVSQKQLWKFLRQMIFLYRWSHRLKTEPITTWFGWKVRFESNLQHSLCLFIQYLKLQ